MITQPTAFLGKCCLITVESVDGVNQLSCHVIARIGKTVNLNSFCCQIDAHSSHGGLYFADSPICIEIYFLYAGRTAFVITRREIIMMIE